LLVTVHILFVTTLVKILNLTFKRQIGLKFSTFIASFFGTRVITPKLRLWSGKIPLWKSSKSASKFFL
jgi:hypothetical protein